jgi:hypothetical protein
MTHSKTTIGGLLSSVGKALAGTGILAQLTQLLPASNVIPASILLAIWWITLAGVVLGVVGTAMTSWFAADASIVNNVAAAVDQINQKGASPLAAPSATNPPTPTAAIPKP